MVSETYALPAGVVTDGATVGQVLRQLATDPLRHIVHAWHWKAALTSAIVRGGLFFIVNLPAGRAAAAAALTTEFAFRLVMSGFYGAITQSFRAVQPVWCATTTVLILLPLLGHSFEFVVHWFRGTALLGASVAGSIALTVLSTSFNLFAMRNGALLVGPGRQPLSRDLERMPGLLVRFVVETTRAVGRLVVRHDRRRTADR